MLASRFYAKIRPASMRNPPSLRISYSGSHVYSTGPIYKSNYGLIVQADSLGNDPAFIPTMHINAIYPETATLSRAKSESLQTRIQSKIADLKE